MNSIGYGYGNFNSHAHVERDIIGANPEEIFAISTHTLTWSVTGKCGKRDSVCRHFNSHAHVERDT